MLYYVMFTQDHSCISFTQFAIPSILAPPTPTRKTTPPAARPLLQNPEHITYHISIP